MSHRLRLAINALMEMFPHKSKSWIRRCIKRLPTVRKLCKNVWFLRCMPELGDRRAYYLVVFDEKTGRYTCSCYDKLSMWGERRRKEMCSHVGAVILSRLIGQEYLKVVKYERSGINRK